ncbi:MAG: HD domain-containing protein [Candidatus Omnitrophica bacterium]|nr:HD domain-containing protein [Candidatus Omnitrophota bacterium]
MDKLPETLQVLLEVSKTIVSNLELDKVAETIVLEAIHVLKTDHAALFLADRKSQHLNLTAANGFNANEFNNLDLMASWERIENEILSTRRPLLVNDLEKSSFKNKLSLKSFLAVPLQQKERLMGILIVSNNHPGRFREEDVQILLTLANHAAIGVLNAELYQETEDLFFSIMGALAEAIDAKDTYTHGHSERVMLYSEGLAKHLALPSNQVKAVKIAALLHDVGKIGIPDAILCKEAPLTEEEYKTMQQHPAIGARIVQNILHSELIVPGIRDHHERFDGKGYPKGIKGEDISLAGRIVSIADAFDAMTTDRTYRKKLPIEESMKELHRCAGSQFDPKLVNGFEVYIVKAREKLFKKPLPEVGVEPT